MLGRFEKLVRSFMALSTYTLRSMLVHQPSAGGMKLTSHGWFSHRMLYLTVSHVNLGDDR